LRSCVDPPNGLHRTSTGQSRTEHVLPPTRPRGVSRDSVSFRVSPLLLHNQSTSQRRDKPIADVVSDGGRDTLEHRPTCRPSLTGEVGARRLGASALGENQAPLVLEASRNIGLVAHCLRPRVECREPHLLERLRPPEGDQAPTHLFERSLAIKRYGQTL
jgi:hypothetical protein